MSVISNVFVFSRNQVGNVGAWSRYALPFLVDHFAQLGNKLYIRSGDDVLMVDETVSEDYAGAENATPFDGVIQTPWLDCGSPGRQKRLSGIDIVASSDSEISIGYNQAQPTYFTTPVAVSPDTAPGTIVPMEVSAPSFSLKITFPGAANTFWEFFAANLYIQDDRLTS